ncbi:hypothetical protein ACQ4PT_055946 [Festuca glaucescens]
MESRSSRRNTSSAPPQHGARGPDGDDRITALPDDMLFQILVRLRCARAAARTGLLSRRWRGLWARLPGLIFRDVPAGVIKAALSHISIPTTVSLLEIRLVESMWAESCKLEDAHENSLLHAAEQLSPEDLIFILPKCPALKPGRPVTIVLPPFARATSIELDTRFLCIKPPMAGELPALETLSVSGNIVDLTALLDCCPRLRVLGVTFRRVDPDSLSSGLAALEAAKTLGLVVSRLGIEYDDSYKIDHNYVSHGFFNGARFASFLRTATSGEATG